MTDYMTANTINDMFRSLFALLDRAAYYLLGWMYEILFNVASADIFANETVHRFYGRVQMILGVFMIFKLAVSIIQGIINPDTFTDKKSGFSSIIGRIVFALIMLTVLTPINIPGAQSDYEKNLNNNGLLFGTLYELQDRILENNTLGRLILGTDYSATQQGENLSSRQNTWLTKSSNRFTAAILRGFVRINLNNNGTDELEPTHRVCSYIESDVLQAYSRDDATPNEILSLVNASCTDQNEGDTLIGLVIGKAKRLFSGDRYVFAYLPIISTIVAAVFIYILLGEIITIAIRSIKLAVLRLLAPIPIISYIDPKSEKDGAFGAWVKSLTSTYLELFIHLAVIYFVIFLIEDMIVNGLVINTGTGLIGVISAIFIWIGLFFFVKQAPKFIKDIIGVKGAGGDFGVAALLAATGAIRQHGTLAEAGEAFMDSTRDYTNAYNAGKAPPTLGNSFEGGRDYIAKLVTGDNNMTGKMQTRGERHLNRMDIDTPRVKQAKNDYLDAQKEADRQEDAYQRYIKGPGVDEATRQRMYDAKEDAKVRAQSLRDDWEDMKGMQKKYGQARSYEAKYEARGRNRAAGAFGRDSEHSNFQRWRTQNYDASGGTDAETPRDSGAPDFTAPGATTPGGPGVSGHGGGPGGPPLGP